MTAKVYMAMKVGPEKSKNAASPPQNDLVAYIEIAVSSWVDVGPGNDWQMLISSKNFSSVMLSQ